MCDKEAFRKIVSEEQEICGIVGQINALDRTFTVVDDVNCSVKSLSWRGYDDNLFVHLKPGDPVVVDAEGYCGGRLFAISQRRISIALPKGVDKYLDLFTNYSCTEDAIIGILEGLIEEENPDLEE